MKPLRLSFRTKLLALVGTAALAFVLLIGVTVTIARQVKQQLTSLEGRHLPRLDLGARLEGQFERLRRSFQDAVAAHDPDAFTRSAQLKTQLLDTLARASHALDPAVAAALREAILDYYQAARSVSGRLMAGETGEPLVEAMKGMQARGTRVLALLKKATDVDERQLSAAFVAARAALNRAARIQRDISIGCLLLVLLLSLWFSRGVLRAVAELTAGLKRYAAGDFEVPVQVLSGDELAEVASQANQMARSLKAHEEELHRAQAKFRALLESAPDAMVIVDSQGRIVLVNAQTERLFGYRRQELLGANVEILLPERSRRGQPGDRTALFTDPSTRGTSADLDLYGRRRDGTELPIEVTLSPLDTEDGLLLSSAIRDISERRQRELALKIANRELEAFSYSVAHDLRAPLRGMNGFAQILLDDYGDKLDDEGRDYLSEILKNAARMGALIDALLSLAGVTRRELQPEWVDLAAFSRTTLARLQAAEPERQVEQVVHAPIEGYFDPALARNLIDNLLGNAWKFTSQVPRARIEVGSEVRDGERVCFVRDNGAGFDMAHAEKLFAPFQRLHSFSEFAGTGIGLATAQRILHRHGGRIWAEAAVGAGATFYFTLPPRPSGASS